MKHKNVVYLLEFKDCKPPNFFKQLKRIYLVYTKKEIGCGVNQIYDCKIEKDKPFENKFVKISLIPLR